MAVTKSSRSSYYKKYNKGDTSKRSTPSSSGSTGTTTTGTTSTGQAYTYTAVPKPTTTTGTTSTGQDYTYTAYSGGIKPSGSSGGGGSSSGSTQTIQPRTTTSTIQPTTTQAVNDANKIQPKTISGTTSTGQAYTYTAVPKDTPTKPAYTYTAVPKKQGEKPYSFEVPSKNDSTPKISYGVPVVTSEEYVNIRGTGADAPVFVLDKSGNLQEQFQVAGSIPQYQGTMGRAKWEENLALATEVKMQYAQSKKVVAEFKENPEEYFKMGFATKTETDDGTSYIITQEAFKGVEDSAGKRRKESRAYASQEYFKLGGKETFMLGAGTQLVVAGKLVGGVGSLIGTEASGLTKEGEEFQPFSIKMKPVQNNLTNDLVYSPTRWYSGEAIIPVGTAVVGVGMLGAGGVRNIQTLGWKAGTVETLSYLSPLRIKSGTYGSNLNEQSRNMKVDRYDVNGKELKIGSGTTPSGTKIVQIQMGDKYGGRGFSTRSGDYWNIKQGGASVDYGTRIVTDKFTYAPTDGGSAYVTSGSITGTGFKGGTGYAQVYSRTYTTVSSTGVITSSNVPFSKTVFATGGSYKPIDGGKKFASGIAETEIGVTRSGVYSPKVVRFKPLLSGREFAKGNLFDFNFEVTSTGGIAGTTSQPFSSSSGGQAFTQIQQTTQTFSQPLVTPTQVVTPSITATTAPSVIVFNPTGQKLDVPTITTTKMREEVIQVPKNKGLSAMDIGGVTPIPTPTFNTGGSKTAQIPIQVPVVVQSPAETNKQVSAIGLVPSTGGGFNFNISGFGQGLPFGLPPFALGGVGGKWGSKKLGTKAKYGYTPDYTSLIKGIKGARGKPSAKGKYTGFEQRPVTEGWMFNIFKKKKKKSTKKRKK